MVALAGHQDQGRLAVQLTGEEQEVQPVTGAQPVVNEADVEAAMGNALRGLVERFQPFENETVGIDFGQEASREDVVILIILHEECADRLHDRLQASGPQLGSSTNSIQ